jgi:diadenosine tetraphosphate (Ap4A) HIT family hydrolase
MLDTHSECSFCAKGKTIFREAVTHLCYDLFPINSGHLLITPIRHVANFSPHAGKENAPPRPAGADAAISDQPCIPDVYNVNINMGISIGQGHACPHFKIDTPDPSSGVRGVVPAKQSHYSSGRWRHERHLPQILRPREPQASPHSDI